MDTPRPSTAGHALATVHGGKRPTTNGSAALPKVERPARRPVDKPWSRHWLAAALSLAGLALTLTACGGNDGGISSDLTSMDDLELDEDQTLGPVDLGWGPGVEQPPSRERQRRLNLTRADEEVTPPWTGGPLAHLQGAFGPVFTWPIIPIHMVLLPDGRVMSYGTNQRGQQGGKNYTVWDPSAGEGIESMLSLKYSAETTIFCNTQVLLPSSGDLLLLGGTKKNEFGEKVDSNEVDLFKPLTNTLTLNESSMSYARWYGTVVTTASGDQVVMGGKEAAPKTATNKRPAIAAAYAATPEVYRPGQGWRTLSGATSEFAYGATEGSWWYPYAWQAPNGLVFVMSSRSGRMYGLDTVESGSLIPYEAKLSGSSSKMPSAMFAPGKILSLRTSAQAVVVDINGPTPVVTKSQPTRVTRVDQAATVLADGRVWVNGGSAVHLQLDGAIYDSELWDPATGSWSPTASATKARLYHSTSILLADGRVLTGGGGAPGPVTNLNAEIFFPPYLFKTDGSGELAERPVIEQVPERKLLWGETIPVGVSAGTVVSRITFVRTGSVTHTFNNEQRFMTLDFVQSELGLDVALPTDRNIAPPGFYLMFVFDANGVPSKAKVLQLSDS